MLTKNSKDKKKKTTRNLPSGGKQTNKHKNSAVLAQEGQLPNVSEKRVCIHLRMLQEDPPTTKKDDVLDRVDSDSDDDYDDEGRKVQEDDAKLLRKVGEMVYLLNNDESTLDKFTSRPKVAKMYLTYQKHFFRFVKKNKVQDFQNEDMLVEFFNSMSSTYAPLTLWVIYSCVNQSLRAVEF